MVHMTMRSVKPSCLSVSAHTRAAGPGGDIHSEGHFLNTGVSLLFEKLYVHRNIYKTREELSRAQTSTKARQSALNQLKPK